MYFLLSFSLSVQPFKQSKSIKADRLHPGNYPHKPTNYRHTYFHVRLVMMVVPPYCICQSKDRSADATGCIIYLLS